MFVHSATRALVSLALIAAPAVAQTALGPYAPATARYRITVGTRTSQNMMGQVQEFEASARQLLSLSVAKAGDALTLTMTLDSATISTTSPEPAPDPSDAIGLKFTGMMALDGKVASSEVTDKSGAPSKSQFATSLRSILPRLKLGATSGATWADSSTVVTKQNDSEVTVTAVVTFALAGDTTVSGMKAWKIVGISAGKMSGTGNRMGTDYAITGDVKGESTSLVSVTGILLGITSDADSNITVTVESAGMTIPITQKTTTKVEKLP